MKNLLVPVLVLALAGCEQAITPPADVDDRLQDLAPALSVGDGASVSNQGRDGQQCFVSGTWTVSNGGATIVQTPSGNTLFTCHGTVQEDPPAQAVRGTVNCGALGSGSFTVSAGGIWRGTCLSS
jgi:hypothetical protein